MPCSATPTASGSTFTHHSHSASRPVCRCGGELTRVARRDALDVWFGAWTTRRFTPGSRSSSRRNTGSGTRRRPAAHGCRPAAARGREGLPRPVLGPAPSAAGARGVRDGPRRRTSALRGDRRGLRAVAADQASPRSTGLTSTTGVPSIASSGRTRIRRSSTSTTSTRCRPIGFGRSGERVLKTPRSGTLGSSRGWTAWMSRSASCSQVRTRRSSPDGEVARGLAHRPRRRRSRRRALLRCPASARPRAA